jgi:quercetin dioxygenase-like cupin family protein
MTEQDQGGLTRTSEGNGTEPHESPRSQRYSPSPRPTFDQPTAIKAEQATRYLWGDETSGYVADRIYASTGAIHALVFELPESGRFLHSEEYRTVFGADELLRVLEGTMVIANPETGEVLRVPEGGNVFFGKNTWHHAFAHGGTPLRVLEIFAPPPSTGASGAYARTRPYLHTSRYADDSVVGALPSTDGTRPQTLRLLREHDVVWRRDLNVLSGFLISTDQLTVHTLEINRGEAANVHAHGGDEILYVTGGSLWVRAWHGGEAFTFELVPDDACFIPEGAEHEYRNLRDTTATALVGVAPSYFA